LPLPSPADSLRALELPVARACFAKGNLNQVNAQRDQGIRILGTDRQFDSYLVAMCSLMLTVVLVVGATGYAGIQGLLSSTTNAAKAARARAATQLTLHENANDE
jgi:hypothetical protein